MLDSNPNTSVEVEEGIPTTERASYASSSSFQDEDKLSEEHHVEVEAADVNDTKDNGIGRWPAIAMVINL